MLTSTNAQTLKAPRHTQPAVAPASELSQFAQLPQGLNSSARAKKHPIEDTPEGTLLTYSLQTEYVSTQMGEWVYRDALKTMVVIDEDVVYIQNFVNTFPYDTWIKGYISDDHKHVTFDNMQPYIEQNGYQYYVSLAYVNMNDDVLADTESDEFTFDYDEATGVLSAPDLEICLCNEDGGVFSYNYGYVLTPFNDELVQLPEGLSIQPYSLAFASNYKYDYPMMVYVARDGNDFYFKGLCNKLLNSWVKGTLEGDSIKIYNDQYLGLYDGLYFIYVRGANFKGLDDYGWPIYSTKPYAALYYDATDGSMYGEDGILFNLGKGNGGYSQSIPSQTMHPFYNVAAKPATPEVRNFDIDLQYYTVPCSMSYVIPVADVDSNFVNPDSLYYRVFVDGEPWHFDKSFYANFVDELEVNCRFSDRGTSMNRTDFQGSYHVLSFPKELRPTTVGLQSIYYMEGTVKYSDIVTYNIATKESVITAGIEAVQSEPVTDTRYYDLCGRPLSAVPARGLVIRQGRITFVR